MARIFQSERSSKLLSGRNKAAIAIVVMALFALLARMRPAVEGIFTPGTESARVVHVVDGDTIVLSDGRLVRYIGMDAPEMDSSGEAERALARLSCDRNRQLVGGKNVVLEFDSQRIDKYGRTLAYVYLGGESVNGQLVAEGLARAAFFGDNKRHLDEYKRLESRAREQKLGMWSLE